MDLILWRHAEAEDGDADTPDHKRRLTARGEKQAKQVAGWLHRHLPRKRKVLVSPTERTQQTAHVLQLAYEIEPRLYVGASARDVLDAAGWPDHRGAVLIIGHQPTLGRIAALLLGDEDGGLSVRKGAVWWFGRRLRRGVPGVALRAAIAPDLLQD